MLAVALVGTYAVPALAAEPRAEVPERERLEILAAVRKDAPQLARELAERERERRGRAAGPFSPLVGEPDYGSADAAFGAARSGHVHAGQDIFAATGTPLVAVTDGVVEDAGSDGGQGNYLHLYDPKRDRTYVYMHMVAPAEVQTGESVEAGQQVGGVGCTGSCYGEHLHFEIRAGKGIAAEPIDPLPELRAWKQLERPG